MIITAGALEKKRHGMSFVDTEANYISVTKYLSYFQVTMRREDRRDPEKLYNKMKIGDLSKNFSNQVI